MAMSSFATYNYSPEKHGHLVPYIAALHAQCITGADGMVGPFLPPLTMEKLLPWWKERLAEAQAGSRVIVLLFPRDLPNGRGDPNPSGTDFHGIAMLAMDGLETGAFRCRIDCVMVKPQSRRRGGAKALVRALEYEAGKVGRTLLLVDAEAGSPADVFKRLGYTEIGQVPKYCQVATGKKAVTFLYKDLFQNV